MKAKFLRLSHSKNSALLSIRAKFSMQRDLVYILSEDLPNGVNTEEGTEFEIPEMRIVPLMKKNEETGEYEVATVVDKKTGAIEELKTLATK